MTNALDNTSSIPQTIASQQFDYMLVDGSGSMQGQWWETLAALDSYVATLKTQQLESHVRMSIFSGLDLDMVARDEDLSSFVPLSESPVGSTWGGTALYDAINIMGRNLRDINPKRCSIVIATDGDERDSRFTNLVQAKAILDWCRAKGWQVTFVGCDFDNSRQARLLGANDSSSVGVSKALLSDATAELARKRARYGKTGEPMHFSDGEKQRFGGYLAKS